MVVDSIDASLIIREDEFFVIDAKVVHSDFKNSNYAEIKCYPSEDARVPADITALRGRTATLVCDTTLSEKRSLLRAEDPFADSSIERDGLLFRGNVARIYRAGDGSIDVVLFDPGQALFEAFSSVTDTSEPANNPTAGRAPRASITDPATDFSQPDSEQTNGTSIQNTEISLVQPSNETEDGSDKVIIKAKDAVNKVLDDIGITDREITLSEGGTTFTVNGQEFKGAFNRELEFKDTEWNAHELLKEVERRTDSTFNFKKDGTFTFGVPEIKRHKLYFVTETTAGIKSPPYQSVKVIGTGIRSESEDVDSPGVISENEAVAKIALSQSESGPDVIPGETREPVYTYKSADLVTDAQIQSTAERIITKIKEQQKGGEITVIGHPEITLNDTLITLREFGGEAYTATKITHRINASDGFTTKIGVSAPVIPDALGNGAVETDAEEEEDTEPSTSFAVRDRRAVPQEESESSATSIISSLFDTKQPEPGSVSVVTQFGTVPVEEDLAELELDPTFPLDIEERDNQQPIPTRNQALSRKAVRRTPIFPLDTEESDIESDGFIQTDIGPVPIPDENSSEVELDPTFPLDIEERGDQQPIPTRNQALSRGGEGRTPIFPLDTEESDIEERGDQQPIPTRNQALSRGGERTIITQADAIKFLRTVGESIRTAEDFEERERIRT